MAYSAQGRTKDFPVFDCDSHIHEPRDVWDEYIPEKQRAFAKQHFYRDMDRLVMVVNGHVSYGNPKTYTYPGQGWHPGMNKKILGSIPPSDPRWDKEIGRNASQRDPQVRLKDMDASGIDQVMVFPSTFVRMPLVKNADAARICATAYNDWVNDYCAADRKRLYPCAVLPVQDVDYSVQELRRVAKLGFKSAVVRPVLVNDRYPTFPEFDPLWKEFEELGMALGMHTFPSGGEAVTEAMAERMSTGTQGKSGAQRSPFTAHNVHVYSPGQFVENIMRSMGSVQPGSESLSFISEAQTWTMVVLLTGWLEKFPQAQGRHPRIQLELAAADPGKGRDLPRPLPLRARAGQAAAERLRPAGDIRTAVLHRLRERRRHHATALGHLRKHRPVVVRHAAPRRLRHLGSRGQHEQIRRAPGGAGEAAWRQRPATLRHRARAVRDRGAGGVHADQHRAALRGVAQPAACPVGATGGRPRISAMSDRTLARHRLGRPAS